MPDLPLGEELGFLVGAAEGPEQVHASAWSPAVTAHARADGRIELGGALVVLTHHEQRPDGTSFDVVNVFTRDRSDGAVLLYAFDTAGYPPDPPARGEWHDNTLVLNRTTPRGTGRTTFTPTPTGYTWAKDFSPPGDHPRQKVVDATLTTRGQGTEQSLNPGGNT